MRYVFYISHACICCGDCMNMCTDLAIEVGEPYVIIKDKCTGCGECEDICPTYAIMKTYR